MADSGSGLRFVSKWGRGPAAEVTGKDALVVLTLGSEVALLSFAEPDSPRVLSEIQFPSLTAQSYLEDSLLYTSSNADLEVWNVADPAQPVKRGQLLGQVGDFWIRDTFLFYIRGDTFHVLSIANPSNLYELGFCLETGAATTGSGNTVVVCQSGGFALVDVSNPASPHEVGSYPCGYALSAAARGNLVCASYEENSDPYPTRFITLDISTQSSPRLLAKLNDLGGYDIFLDGPLAFVSGGEPGTEDPLPFQILSIADSAHPTFIDSCRTTDRYPWGVWESYSLNRTLVADEYQGLAIVDISNLNNPVLDTCVLVAGCAGDIDVDGTHCYVASEIAGLRILDVTDPERPTCVSGLDTMWAGLVCDAAAVHDSFAYIGWTPSPTFRSVDVTDPLGPQIVAGCSLPNFPEDMVLRDSYVYCAEYGMLHVVNVARPRAPTAVGTCLMGEYNWGICLKDTFAYVGSWVGLIILNVARPDSPFVVSTTSGNRTTTYGVAVKDTFAFIPSGYETLWVYSVANPAAPYPIAAVPLGADNRGCDAVMYNDTLVFAGCLHGVVLVNVSDPAHPRAVSSYPAPDWVRRVLCSPPYLYACCSDAGVMVLETTAVGLQEPSAAARPLSALQVAPNPAGRFVRVRFGGPLPSDGRLYVYDASGRRVSVKPIRKGVNEAELDLTGMSSGLYFVRLETSTGVLKSKIVKR